MKTEKKQNKLYAFLGALVLVTLICVGIILFIPTSEAPTPMPTNTSLIVTIPTPKGDCNIEDVYSSGLVFDEHLEKIADTAFLLSDIDSLSNQNIESAIKTISESQEQLKNIEVPLCLSEAKETLIGATDYYILGLRALQNMDIELFEFYAERYIECLDKYTTELETIFE